jgi:RNA polymerase subunit RPABC4/transcription elongation factor Spt4
MRIYRMRANVNNYRTLQSVEDGIVQYYRRFDGTPLEDPSRVRPLVVRRENADTPIGDFPGLTSHIPVFSQKGVEALGEILDSAGEWVPVLCRDCDAIYVGLNVTGLVDALDVDRSVVKRYRSGRIMRVIRYAFAADALQDVTVFKIPETAVQEVYVTQPFVDAFVRSSLRGGVFELLWTDEPYLILCPYCQGIIDEGTAFCPTCGLDTRRDAPWEVSLDELLEIERKRCSACAMRISASADPCPFCKEGAQRPGVKTGVVVV